VQFNDLIVENAGMRLTAVLFSNVLFLKYAGLLNYHITVFLNRASMKGKEQSNVFIVRFFTCAAWQSATLNGHMAALF
jgi:hypothetical protein